MGRRTLFILLTTALLSLAVTATLSAADTAQPLDGTPDAGAASLSEAVTSFGHSELTPLALNHPGTQIDSAPRAGLTGYDTGLTGPRIRPRGFETSVDCWNWGGGVDCTICFGFEIAGYIFIECYTIEM